VGTEHDPDEPAAATSAAVGESRAPVVITAVVVIVLPFLMPPVFRPHFRWELAVVEVLLVVTLLVMDPGRIDRRSQKVRVVSLALIAAIATGSAFATARLVAEILGERKGTNSAIELLWAGSLVWTYLVITFGFLYWQLDSGGPGERAHSTRRHPDLLFPQQAAPHVAPEGWRPVFLDYLYLGLTNALAFSPTDAMPLRHWAKAAMGFESVASLVILGLVVARAVNILN
jgi:hypothetical protein